MTLPFPYNNTHNFYIKALIRCLKEYHILHPSKILMKDYAIKPYFPYELTTFFDKTPCPISYYKVRRAYNKMVAKHYYNDILKSFNLTPRQFTYFNFMYFYERKKIIRCITNHFFTSYSDMIHKFKSILS